MAFPEVHYLLAWGGTLGAETWVNTLRLSDGFALADQAEEESALAEFADVITTWHEGGGVVGSRARLGWVKLNRVGVDGRYVRDYTNLLEIATPVAGGQAPLYPNQVSLVATLETGATRGLASRGRLFIPCPATPLVAVDGLLSTAVAQGAATAAATFLSGLNAAVANMAVEVYSNTRTGAHRPVTTVSVGRVLDTMQSRRTSLPEERQAAAVVASP